MVLGCMTDRAVAAAGSSPRDSDSGEEDGSKSSRERLAMMQLEKKRGVNTLGL